MEGLVGTIDRALLASIGGLAPKVRQAQQSANIAEIADTLPALMDRFAINTERRIEHFLSQTAHESDGFCTMREYASGAAYEGRKDLGNIRPGDGRRYPGRGLIELTGRANARTFTLWLRSIDPSAPDFEASPDLMEDFPYAAWTAIWFWTVKNLNVLADRDDLVGITRIINGGRNGLSDRERRLDIARRLVDVRNIIVPLQADIISKSQDGYIVLYRGIKGHDIEVERLQRALRNAGHYFLSIDGDFGPGTENAVRTFQRSRSLLIDGKVGKITGAALEPFINEDTP